VRSFAEWIAFSFRLSIVHDHGSLALFDLES